MLKKIGIAFIVLGILLAFLGVWSFDEGEMIRCIISSFLCAFIALGCFAAEVS